MFRRIQWRIAAAYVALIVAAMLALGLALTALVRARQLSLLEDQLAREARLVADDATVRLAHQASPAELDALAKSLGQASGVRITLIARDGTVLGDSDHDPRTMENHAGRPEVVQALAFGQGQSARHSATLDRDLLYVAVPMRDRGQVVGVARVALPLSRVNDLLNQLVLLSGIATALAAALAVAVAVVIARATTGPLERLARLARALAAGQLDQRITVASPDEVGQVAAAFNQMAAELQEKIEAIEEQRSEMAAILGGMADGVIIVDERDRIVALNRAAERMLEMTEAAARGRPLGEVVRQRELGALLDQPAPPASPPLIALGPDRRQVQIVVTPVHVGHTTRRIILLQDVTALRQAEAMRRDFVANVSHELRTPLASLRALVETLENGALEDPPATREFLGRMHAEVDSLGQMVEELLELARIESGRLRVHFDRADIGQVVAEAVTRLEPQAERQGVRLALTVPAAPVTAVVDADRLKQIVINLVHNAIKFTPPGGAAEVRVEPRGASVAIVVSDTGIGVSAADLPRLFERFYKADRSRASAGTGLGLAIVKHLVQLHGGQVWAASPGEGKGTTLTVLLPVDGPPAPPAAETAAAPSAADSPAP